jgi:hypothetical protein
MITDIIFIHPQNSIIDLILYSCVLREIRKIHKNEVIHYFVMKHFTQYITYICHDIPGLVIIPLQTNHRSEILKRIQMQTSFRNMHHREIFGTHDEFRFDSMKNIHKTQKHDNDLSVYGYDEIKVIEGFTFTDCNENQDPSYNVLKFNKLYALISSLKCIKYIKKSSICVTVRADNLFKPDRFFDCFTTVMNASKIYLFCDDEMTFFVICLYKNGILKKKNITIIINETITPYILSVIPSDWVRVNVVINV